MLMQLSLVFLGSNKLVGSLPETWSNLTNVSPIYCVDSMVLVNVATVAQGSGTTFICTNSQTQHSQGTALTLQPQLYF